MAYSAIVALCLLALASAAPQCSTSCDASSKMSYIPGSTYTYDYTGIHKINIEGVEEGSSTSDYAASVIVTVVGPCDVAFSLQNVAGSNIAEIQERQVEKYPLMVSFNNGQIKNVCSHPDDDTNSINIKKAIASAFQNVLPTLEPSSDPQVFTENDITGICPTKYTIVTEGTKTVVTKEKDHGNCQEHYYDQTRTSALPSKTPIPIQDSKSKCVLEIDYGTYSTIRCSESKYITPAFGLFKYVMATQEFNLKLVSISTDTSAVSSIEGQELKAQSIRHQQELPIKNIELVSKVDAIMPEICTFSQGQGNTKVASLVAQVTELLRFVPDDAVVQILDKIRAGQYCADYTRLESLFLDAVAFVGEPGAFKVMAQEVAVGRTTGGRFGLYTIAVNILTKPTLDHVAALTPIFGMTDSNQLLSLAASTVVNRYCTQNEDCDQTAPVQEILNVLSAKLDTQCTPDFSNVETTQVLTTLKSMGNIGKTTTALFASVMKCALTEGIETNVRFAATMSLKGVSCSDTVTQRLKSVVLDASINTEVRIGSYLAAVRCAKVNDFEEVINAMSAESNKQVEAFILSHLHNLQETNWPLKQQLQGFLDSKNIPINYMRNILKYSTNVEMSANIPVIELGGLVESNIVYTPESYVPRLVNLGLNMNLLGSFINIGEVGVRVEGIDPFIDDAIGPNSYLYKDIFGPDSYLYKTPLWSLIEDSQLFMTQRGTEILQQIQQLIKEKNINPDSIIKSVNKIIKNTKNININTVLKAFNKVLKNAKDTDIKSALKSVDFDSILKSVVSFLKNNNFPKTDIYAMLRAQEVGFLSFGGKQIKFNLNELVESVFLNGLDQWFNILVAATSLNVDSTRTGQINIDYSIPTISGIPLKVKLTGTGVAGLQLTNAVDVKDGALNSLLKIIPSLSAQIEGQIGFGELLNTGLKLRSSAYTTNGFALNVVQKNGEDLELQLELPEKMELFNIETETFLMKLDKTSWEVKLFPRNMQDIRITSNQCSGVVEPVTGLMICYSINVPDLLKSNSLPLGQPLMFKLYLEKADPALKGYRLAAKVKNKPNNKSFKIVAGTYGSANSKESTMRFIYGHKRAQGKTRYEISLDSAFLVSSNELTYSSQKDGYKSLQYYTSNEIGRGIAVEGSAKVDFKVIGGKRFEIATYAGFSKSLDLENRLFLVVLDASEKGANQEISILTSTDLFPASIEVRFELPTNAGFKLYKMESLSLTTAVHAFDVQAQIQKKSSEVYQTSLTFRKSGSEFASFMLLNTISIESPLTGFEAIKLNFETSATAKLPRMIELSAHSSLSYANGVVESFSSIKHWSNVILALSSELTLDISSPACYIMIELPPVALTSRLSMANSEFEFLTEVTYFSSDIVNIHVKQTLGGLPFTSKVMIEVPNVLLVDFQHEVASTGITTVAKVEAPAFINPLKFENVFGFREAFAYSLLTDVTSKDSLLLRMEGTSAWDMTIHRLFMKEILDLKISGAFDGTYKILREITLSDEKFQYTFDVSHTTTPIVFVELVLDGTNTEDVLGKIILNVPLVIESELASTISSSLIHSTLNSLVLPNTVYERRFKGYADFNLVENNFKGELFLNAEKDMDQKVELSTKFVLLDTAPLKVNLQGELTVLSLIYGYKLESVLASPFEYFQGDTGFEFTVTVPSQKQVKAKSMFNIQYGEDHVTLTPVISFMTPNEHQYTFTSILAAKSLRRSRNFEVTSETTVETPELQQVTLISKLRHVDDFKKRSGKLAFTMDLKESVLSKAGSLEYILEWRPARLSVRRKAQYGAKIATLDSNIRLKDFKKFEITHELKLPLEVVKSVIVRGNKSDRGSAALGLFINGNKIVNIYYFYPDITDHTFGIEFPYRTLECGVLFTHVQATVKVKSDSKEVETILRLTPKASALQFEALVTAPSLTKEMRLAVDLELIEPGKVGGYDMVNVDVQYQVSEAPKLLMATLSELQIIYGDLVNDGLLPDFNNLYRIAQMWTKRLPKQLNKIRDQLMVMVPQYYGYFQELYQQYEADLIVLRNKIQSGLLMYWDLVKREATLLLQTYVEVIKKSETWKVIIQLFSTLSDAVSMLLQNFNVNFMKQELATLLTNFISQLRSSKALMQFQEKFSELKTLYPKECGVLEYVYTDIISPTMSDSLEIIYFILNTPDVFQHWEIVVSDLREVSAMFTRRLLNTPLLMDLRTTYPAAFEIAEDLYNNVVLTTYNEVIQFIMKIRSLPVDFKLYWQTIQVEVPTLARQFTQRLLDTQLVKQLVSSLLSTFPNVYNVASSLYNGVLMPTLDDILTVLEKLISLPILG
ncbi:unnamed protein product, partial [Meganyctiphanes norvegica]